MGQPTPPGDIPLYEGLGSEWNDIVGAIPEDRRSELAPILKQRIDQYEPLKKWEEFHKSGITPEHAGQALQLHSIIENNPRQVYDFIGQQLGITPQQAQEVVEEIQEADEDDDPRIAALKHQVDTLTQIALAQRQQSVQSQYQEQAEKELQDNLDALKRKYGEIDEQQVIMRMLHLDMTPEQAYQDYMQRDNEIRSRRPAPMIMGSGGVVPRNAVDVKKLSGSDTRALVAQMMQHGNEASK